MKNVAMWYAGHLKLLKKIATFISKTELPKKL
jgi:hypothetical protein